MLSPAPLLRVRRAHTSSTLAPWLSPPLPPLLQPLCHVTRARDGSGQGAAAGRWAAVNLHGGVSARHMSVWGVCGALGVVWAASAILKRAFSCEPVPAEPCLARGVNKPVFWREFMYFYRVFCIGMLIIHHGGPYLLSNSSGGDGHAPRPRRVRPH